MCGLRESVIAMKTETTQILVGIECKVLEYKLTGNDKPIAILDSFRADLDQLAQDLIGRFDGFVGVGGVRPEELLLPYGKSGVLWAYAHDNFVAFDGAKIVQATVEDGRQAVMLIEHCLNHCTQWAGTPLQRYRALSRIPFRVGQAIDGRKVLNLLTGAEHPHLLVRERCFIYIVELASPCASPSS